MKPATSEEKRDAWKLAASWLDDGSMDWGLGPNYTPDGDQTLEQRESADRVRQHIRTVVVRYMLRQAELIEQRRR